MSGFAVTTTQAQIDAILSQWQTQIGADVTAYRHHVYRMYNLSRYLFGQAGLDDPDGEDKLAVAAAFHDLGIWPEGTLDYLPPSIDRARAYLAELGREDWSDEVASMIGDHHKIRRSASFPLTEIFRQADYADFTLGLVRFGIPLAVTRDVNRAFPNAGFHWRLTRLFFAWVVRNPARPLPMFKY